MNMTATMQVAWLHTGCIPFTKMHGKPTFPYKCLCFREDTGQDQTSLVRTTFQLNVPWESVLKSIIFISNKVPETN